VARDAHVNSESIVLAEYNVTSTSDEIMFGAVLQGSLVDSQCSVYRLDRAINVPAVVRVAHDERGRQNPALDQLLEEQGTEHLRGLTLLVSREEDQVAFLNCRIRRG